MNITKLHNTNSRIGLIYFTCINYKTMGKCVKQKIVNLCKDVGKEDSEALFKLVTTRQSVVSICLDNYIDKNKLYRLRNEFYKRW